MVVKALHYQKIKIPLSIKSEELMEINSGTINVLETFVLVNANIEIYYSLKSK